MILNIYLLGLFFSSLSLISGYQINKRCPLGKFTCHDHTCISMAWKCDGKKDCIGGEDEMNCKSYIPCMDSKQFLCNDGSCISTNDRCNGRNDCRGGEDEIKCEARACNNQTEFACRYQKGQCVPISASCDGIQDCIDHTDEAVEICLQRNANQLICKSDEFTCRSGACILQKFKCDNRFDCTDQSDEDRGMCDFLNKKQEKCHPEDEFTCTRHTQCISVDERCDGILNCKDGSDEERCSQIDHDKCEYDDEFYCGLGECTNKDNVCDGINDCLNSQDEKNCNAKSCEKYQFFCAAEKACLPGAVVCDGNVDCSDHSDENNCKASKKKNSCDPTLQFDCFGDGTKCINLSMVCDRHLDCGNQGQDEQPAGDNTNCGRNPCSLENGGCAHNCHNHFVRRVCSCKKGFKLADDEVSCEDVDECTEKVGACSQLCINVKGNFQCDCRNGYNKNFTNPNRCEATGEKFLLYATLDSIRELRMMYNHLRSVVEDTRGVVDIEYGYSASPQTLFWSEITPTSGGRIMRARLGPGVSKKKSVVVDERVHTPDGLAFDWINNLLFWTDKFYKQISVVNVTSGVHTVIVSGLDHPRAIVVDPTHAMLYWTDWGKNPKIESCGTNGQARTVLVSTDIKVPNGLALDIANNQLLWADAGLSLIATIDLKTKKRRVIAQSTQIHPFSLSVFEDRVYWSDWRAKSIFSMDKFTGADVVRIARTDNPMGLRILHQLQQPRVTSMCASNTCSHICLPAMRSRGYNSVSYTCACPFGMVLSENNNCVKGGNNDTSWYSRSHKHSSKSIVVVDKASNAKEQRGGAPVTGNSEKEQVEGNVGTIAALVCGSIFLVTFVGSLIGYLLHRNYMALAVRSVNFENPIYDADAAMCDAAAEINPAYQRVNTAEELTDLAIVSTPA